MALPTFKTRRRGPLGRQGIVPLLSGLVLGTHNATLNIHYTG
jgi:hypothetical protein